MRAMSVQEAMRIAVQLREAGRFSEAEAILREVLGRQASHGGTLVELGITLKAMGRLNEAIAAYRQAAAANPNMPEAYNNLGVALRANGELGEAIAAYREAIRLKGDFAGAYSNLGYALRDSAQLDEAVAACRRAVALMPDLAEAHLNLALMLLQRGDFEEKFFRRSLQQRGEEVLGFGGRQCVGMGQRGNDRLELAMHLSKIACPSCRHLRIIDVRRHTDQLFSLIRRAPLTSLVHQW